MAHAALIVLCVVSLQLKSAECRVACLYEGYANGEFDKGNCKCFDLYDPKDLIAKKYQQSKRETENATW